jgi:hypothetical protein
MLVRLLASFILLLSISGLAAADDWNAVRLRGQVLQLIDGAWQPLHRGDMVPDGNVVRTLGSGMVDLVRGEETVSLKPNTQIVIADRSAKKPFTVVSQYFGTVEIEAEVRNVQHFAVVTPFLAAVVKGTKFIVQSGKTGASVSVQRGHVAVEDKHDRTHVLLSVGQRALVDRNKTRGAIEVSGAGDLPVVTASDGAPLVVPVEDDDTAVIDVADAVMTAAELAAKAKEAEELAHELGTPEAKAAADAAKDAADAAKKAEDAAKKAAKAAADAAKKTDDEAEKAAKEAAEKAEDEAKKAAEDARKAAEKAAKAAEDAAKRALEDSLKHGGKGKGLGRCGPDGLDAPPTPARSPQAEPTPRPESRTAG